jgi:hypothetical protein
MEQSPSWEANIRSAGQNIHHILLNPETQGFLHMGLILIPVLSRLNQATQSHPVSLRKTYPQNYA